MTHAPITSVVGGRLGPAYTCDCGGAAMPSQRAKGQFFLMCHKCMIGTADLPTMAIARNEWAGKRGLRKREEVEVYT